MNFFGHLSTINHHKWLVMQHCFKVGLYRQGLLHDLSKYSPVEFLAGVQYYQGFESPNNAERQAIGCTIREEISTTWNIGQTMWWMARTAMQASKCL